MIARFAAASRTRAGSRRPARLLRWGLLPAPDGDGFTLACAPAFEGSVYQTSTAARSDPYPELARLTQPT